MKKIVCILAIIVASGTTNALAAEEFSISLPSNTSVTMSDTFVTMPFLVTNSNNSTKELKSASITIDTTVYNISDTTTAPSGWSVGSVSSATVCFLKGTGGSTIAPGESMLFKVNLTGPSGGGITAASQDATDAISSATASNTSSGCTTQHTLTSSSTWTRRSLKVDMSVTPSSVGTGSTVTLIMQVTNRSTATQNTITANPDPPTAYQHGLTNLSGTHTSSQTTITVVSTTAFPSSGTIQIDSEEITYTGKTSTTFTGCTRGANGTTASFHPDVATVYNRTSTSAVSNSGGPTYGKSPFNLTSGELSTITWTYTANSSGNIYFSSSARNSGVTATSAAENSNILENINQVVIGSFNAIVTVDTLSVISGATVTVTMTVINNGTSALGTVTPTLSTGGSATITLASGPTPSTLSSLGAGKSGTFKWTYTISGSNGQTYFFSGYASSGGSNTNTSVSATGTIASYAVTVDPDTVASASTNVQIGYTVYNGGSDKVNRLDITFPSGWTYSSATAGDWSVSRSGSIVTYTSGTKINVGGSKAFYITYSSVPTVDGDREDSFKVKTTDDLSNTAILNAKVRVAKASLTLAYSPASPIAADGTTTYTLTATLTAGGSAVSGATVSFSATAGTLSAETATTDSSGIATVYLIAPCSTSDISEVKIKAQYIKAKDTDTVAFSGVSGGNLVYVGGSLSPMSVSSGYASGFTLQLKNCGSSSLTISQTSNTSFDFGNDSFSLASSSYTITSGSTQTIGFSGTVATSNAKCTPVLKVDAGAGYTRSFSYNNGKTPAGDSIDDDITIDSGTDCTLVIQMQEWREMP